MKKKMHIKYDLSGNKKDDIVECLIKDNIITYFDDDYKMKIDLINHKINRENNEIYYEEQYNEIILKLYPIYEINKVRNNPKKNI